MAVIPGSVTITGFVAPTDTADTFPTHDSKYGKGGHREVETLAERDAIAPDRRKEGMTVWVKENGHFYGLIGGTLNTNWVDYGDKLGGGTAFDPAELLAALRQGDPISAICSFPGRLENVVGLMRFYPYRDGKFTSMGASLGYVAQGQDIQFQVIRHKVVGSGNDPIAFKDTLVSSDPLAVSKDFESFDATIYEIISENFVLPSMQFHKMYTLDTDFAVGDFFTINITQTGVFTNPGSHLTITLRG